nr:hypothetical protein [Tanacetum cinerariifolium]
MQAAQDRQKSYVDRKRKPMEFEVGDKIMLKVSPWKGVVRFDLKKCYSDEPLVMPLEGVHIDDMLQFEGVTLCTAHTGTYELGESSAAATARLGAPVRDGLYRIMDTIERGGGFTPAAMEVGYGITDAWDDLAKSMDASDAAHFGVIALRTQVSAQQSDTNWRVVDYRFQTTVGTQQEEIKELRAADRKLRAQLIQVLTALKSCQTQLTAALGRIQIVEATRIPAQPEKMAPKRTTRANPANTTTTTTTVTDAQLEALIEQGIAKALRARDGD